MSMSMSTCSNIFQVTKVTKLKEKERKLCSIIFHKLVRFELLTKLDLFQQTVDFPDVTGMEVRNQCMII